jgi:hypothetical protein
VGTENEAKAAIHLSVLRYQENNSCLPFCLQKLVAHLGINTEETVTNDQILEKWLPRVSSE